MDKPQYASHDIEELISRCWKHNPDERITFNQLEQSLGKFIDKITRQRFVSDDKVKY